MRHCPECGSEFQDWVQNCVDCGAELKDGPPPEQPLKQSTQPEEADFQFGGEFATVATFGNEIEAQLYQSILETEGIQSYIFSEKLIYGSENCVGATRLRVKAREAEKALVIINEIIKENSQSADGGGPDGKAVIIPVEGVTKSNAEIEYTEPVAAEAEIEIRCPLCSSNDIQHPGAGILRSFRRDKWKCRDCGHTFTNPA